MPDSSTTTAFKTNLNSLLSILEEEVPRNNGFYMITTGSNSDKIYGLVQCRGYVSAQDCGTCIKGAVNETFNDCKNSNYAAVWFRWRFLRYSKEYFYGQLDSLIRGMSWDQYTTSTDDPTVVTTGMNFMRQLTAEVPDHPFMFKTGSVSVGQKGKWYGFVQCNRDLSESVCGDCLTSLADFFNQVQFKISKLYKPEENPIYPTLTLSAAETWRLLQEVSKKRNNPFSGISDATTVNTVVFVDQRSL